MLLSRERIHTGICSAEAVAAAVRDAQATAGQLAAVEQQAQEVALFEGFVNQRWVLPCRG